MPVLRPPELTDPRPLRIGDSAVLIEVENARAALRIDVVESVSTLPDADDGANLITPDGSTIPLLDPPAFIRATLAAAQAAAAESSR